MCFGIPSRDGNPLTEIAAAFSFLLIWFAKIVTKIYDDDDVFCAIKAFFNWTVIINKERLDRVIDYWYNNTDTIIGSFLNNNYCVLKIVIL